MERIGSGGYGEVWLCRNVVGTFLAVKIVRRAEFDDDRPYEREFNGIRKFEPISRTHERFVDILQIGRNDPEGFFYYVMELADRLEPSATKYRPRTLASELKKRGALAVPEVLQIAQNLGRALAELHRHGLVHRDIKPSNIIFVDGVPKLADIGLVSSSTESKSFVGTEGFIPPEGPGRPQADVYSLGIVLYVMATGKHHRDFPEPLAEFASRPDRERWLELQAIIHRACAPEPRDRYPNADAMLTELELLQQGHSIKQKRAFQQRWKLVKEVILTCIVLALVSAGANLLLRDRNQDQSLSSNERAQKLYAQSASLLNAETLQETLQASSNLLEAVTLDPKFVQAYYRLCEAQFSDWADQLPPRYNQLANAKWVSDRIRTLRPNSAEYHAVNSYLASLEWDVEKAISEARLACSLDPKFHRAHTLYGWWILLFRGDVTTARKEFQIAERLDYQDIITQSMLGRIHLFQRNMPMAIAQYRELARLESRANSTHDCLRRAYEADRQYDKALDESEAYELSVTEKPVETRVKYHRYREVLAQQGHIEMWRTILDDLKKERSPDLYEMARLCARLGNKDEVFALMDKAREEHHGQMLKLLFDDCWDALRNDPRFDRQLELMHLAKIRPLAM
jgi:serine/threonine protein kinase